MQDSGNDLECWVCESVVLLHPWPFSLYNLFLGKRKRKTISAAPPPTILPLFMTIATVAGRPSSGSPEGTFRRNSRKNFPKGKHFSTHSEPRWWSIPAPKTLFYTFAFECSLDRGRRRSSCFCRRHFSGETCAASISPKYSTVSQRERFLVAIGAYEMLFNSLCRSLSTTRITVPISLC